MKILMLVLLTLLPFLGMQQRAIPPNPQTKVFTRVERIGEPNGRAFFMFATSSRNYTIRHDGHGESYAVKVFRRNFDLKMGAGGRLERVYYLEEEGDVLLVYEVMDQRYDWGYAMRMNQKTLKVDWITEIDALNIGPIATEGDYGYLSGSNFLAKIDLRSGRYIWSHATIEKEFEPEFLEFQLPDISSDHVVFHENKADGRFVEVDKTTGKILLIRQ